MKVRTRMSSSHRCAYRCYLIYCFCVILYESFYLSFEHLLRCQTVPGVDHQETSCKLFGELKSFCRILLCQLFIALTIYFKAFFRNKNEEISPKCRNLHLKICLSKKLNQLECFKMKLIVMIMYADLCCFAD